MVGTIYCGILGGKKTRHLLDLEESMDQLARASSVCWYGAELRKDVMSIVRRKAPDFNVKFT